jgi:threonine dehydrogenase-like Zn-dependent dehydrogenase
MFDTWVKVKELLSIPRFRSRIRKIITHKMPFRDIDRAMELLMNKEAVKVLLEPKW